MADPMKKLKAYATSSATSPQRNLDRNEDGTKWRDDLIVPIGSINTYLYCERRAALALVELTFTHNHHTTRGKNIHQRVDTLGTHQLRGVSVMRRLSVWSERWGIRGLCDVVERHRDESVVPVEYKKGSPVPWVNDDAQVCAQALCLEEMFNTSIPHGYVYHALNKKRRKVLFDDGLRDETKNTISSIRDLLKSQITPPAVLSNKCDGCSMRSTCMPEFTDQSRWSHQQKNIFVPRNLDENMSPSIHRSAR